MGAECFWAGDSWRTAVFSTSVVETASFFLISIPTIRMLCDTANYSTSERMTGNPQYMPDIATS